MQASRALLINMGNDLLSAPVDVGAISALMLEAGAAFPRAEYVFGGSCRLWGYNNDVYDGYVADICVRVGARNGVAELFGVALGDKIGHLQPISIGVFVRAVVSWAAPAIRSKL